MFNKMMKRFRSSLRIKDDFKAFSLPSMTTVRHESVMSSVMNGM